MSPEKQYYAFISYSHKDEEWAKWLQHEFEHYHLPTALSSIPDVPNKFRPIFRDIDELSGGELRPQISRALKSSSYLVIICSPNSAKSSYVDEEIREFVEIGKQSGIDNLSNIFPFIVDGVPHSKDINTECFSRTLREFTSELIAGDVTKHGREHAFVKILSGTLQHSQIGFSMLWNQFERDRIEAERKERERRDKLLLLESRFLSEKALSIAHTDSVLAKKLVLRALPKNVNDPEDRPYCIEAEDALRKLCAYKSTVFKGHEGEVYSFKLNSKRDRGVSASQDGTIRIWDIESGAEICKLLRKQSDKVFDATFSHNGKIIASCSKDSSIALWNSTTGDQIRTLISSNGYAKRILFTHDDKFLVTLSDNTIGIWDVDQGSLFKEIQVPTSNDISIDKKDQWIALATACTSIEVYDLDKCVRVKTIHNAHTECLSSIDISSDGKKIVSSTFWGEFIVRDWQSGEILLHKKVCNLRTSQQPRVYSVKFNVEGNQVVTASSDNIIRIWSIKTGEQIGESLVGHIASVYSASFSDDGRCIISSSADKTARIWDLNPQFPYRVIGRARYIPFESENIKSSLSVDGRLRLMVSPQELQVWDVISNMQIGPNLTCFDNFHLAMFQNDNRGIISETENDYDVLFEWPPLQKLIDKTSELVRNRLFTEEEKKKYYLE